ncbi:mCG119571, partial [Mus musculus]
QVSASVRFGFDVCTQDGSPGVTQIYSAGINWKLQVPAKPVLEETQSLWTHKRMYSTSQLTDLTVKDSWVAFQSIEMTLEHLCSQPCPYPLLKPLFQSPTLVSSHDAQ